MPFTRNSDCIQVTGSQSTSLNARPRNPMSLSHSTLNCIQTGRGNTLQTKQEAERNQHIEPSYCAASTMERWSSLLGCHTSLLLWIHILNWLTTVGTAQWRGGGGVQVKPHLCWFSDASGMIISSALPEPTHRLALTCLYCVLNVQTHSEIGRKIFSSVFSSWRIEMNDMFLWLYIYMYSSLFFINLKCLAFKA